MRSRLRRTRYLSVACALPLLVTACSSSAASNDSKPGEIAIGVLGQFTGPFAAVEAAIPKALNAWTRTVNANGGVNGHTVRLITKDVGTATAAGLSGVRELTQDHVVAILDFDPNDATWVRAAASSSIPVIPGISGFSNYLSSDVFPVTTSGIATAYGIVAQGKVEGDVLGAAYLAGSATSGQYIQMLKAFAKSVGVTIPVTAQIAASAPDYTAFCQQLKDAGAKSYFLALAAQQQVTDQCHQQGVQAAQVLIGSGALPAWKTDPAYAGDYVVDGVAPFFATATPAQKAYRKALTKYEPAMVGTALDGAAAASAWITAQLVATVVPKITGSITASAVQGALYQVKNETLGGLTAPLTYAKGSVHSVSCYFVWQVSNGKFLAADPKPKCAPEAVIAPVEKAAIKAAGG